VSVHSFAGSQCRAILTDSTTAGPGVGIDPTISIRVGDGSSKDSPGVSPSEREGYGLD